MSEQQVTPWFTSDVKPVRRGVYALARPQSAHYGWAYSYWDGEKWCQHEQWGAYHDSASRGYGNGEFVWRGLLH